MDAWPGVPEGVGPHEFRELELMLAGDKPLAVFVDEDPGNFEIPEADFDVHVAVGRFVKKEAVYPHPDRSYAPRYIYFALPEEAWRIDKLHAINAAILGGSRKATENDELEIGGLLGYSDQQIQAYLAHVRTIRHGAGKA
jgi:hypothetical protein